MSTQVPHIQAHNFGTAPADKILSDFEMSRMEARLAVQIHRIKFGPEFESLGICPQGILGCYGPPCLGNMFIIPWTLAYSYVGKLPPEVGVEYMEYYFGDLRFH